jgi:hypothetical protein
MGDQSAGHKTETHLSPQHFYRHDPLLVLVRDRLHLGAGWSAVGTALLTAAVLLGVPALVRVIDVYLFGYLFGAPALGTNPTDQQWILTGLLQSLLIEPIAVAIYVSLPNALSGLFNSLKKNDVIGEACRPGTESYAAFERKLITWADNRWWVALALTGVIVYWLYRLLTPVAGDSTKDAPEWARTWLILVILLAYSPVMYGFLTSLARFLVSLVFTSRLFLTFRIRINPLHPDGSGGLGAIGRMLAVSVLVATAIGAAATGMNIANLSAYGTPFARAENWVLGIVYLVSLPLLFLGWLWAPHRAMLAAREEALRPWADEFRRSIPEVVPSSQDDADMIKANTERLAEIKRQYELLKETYLVWPIQTPVLKGLVVTSLLPLITSLLSSFVSNIQDAIVTLFKGG